jgi:hypothetical protein
MEVSTMTTAGKYQGNSMLILEKNQVSFVAVQGLSLGSFPL